MKIQQNLNLYAPNDIASLYEKPTEKLKVLAGDLGVLFSELIEQAEK